MHGVHSRCRALAPGCGPAAVFLDRDGVIVEDIGYLHQVERIEYIPGALAAVARLNAAGIPVIVVTNQAGIGRGYYGWEEFETVQRRIETDLAAEDGWFDGVWACACHPDGQGDLRDADHPWRKPNPGMLRDAAMKLGIDLRASWMVGDKPLDIETAVRGGLEGALHVSTGYGRRTRGEVDRLIAADPASACRIGCCDDLPDAIGRLLFELQSHTLAPGIIP